MSLNFICTTLSSKHQIHRKEPIQNTQTIAWQNFLIKNFIFCFLVKEKTLKKQFISLIMALCLSFSLAIPIAASESINEKICRDMRIMSSARLFTDGMTVSSVNGDGTITYEYPLTQDVSDYVTLYYKDNGNVDVEVIEDDCRDVITLEQSGRVLINGKEFPATLLGNQNVAQPNVAFSYSYSPTPFKGTYDSQYNVGPVNYNSRSVLFDKAIRYLTGYAIGFGIATYLFPGSASQAAEVCANIGLSLKTKAEQLADDSNALSYKVTAYGRSGNDTFTFYRKYAGTYYTRANYNGDTVYKSLYEKRSTLS